MTRPSDLRPVEELAESKPHGTRLGYQNDALQFRRDLMTVRNAARIERLYRKLTA